MSDNHRKDTTTKVKETLTPEVMKSDAQKIKEATTGTADRVAREGQSDTTKSGFQEALDKTERGKDNTKHGSTHQTIGEKIKHATGLDK